MQINIVPKLIKKINVEFWSILHVSKIVQTFFQLGSFIRLKNEKEKKTKTGISFMGDCQKRQVIHLEPNLLLLVDWFYQLHIVIFQAS